MKKLLAVFLSMALAVTVFTACSDKNDDKSGSSANAKAATQEDLDTAISKAKLAYGTVAEVMTDMNVSDFSQLEGVYAYPDFNGPNEDLSNGFKTLFSEDADFSGELYVGFYDYEGRDLPFIHYRPDGVDLVGQYPYGPESVDDMPEWGVYTDYSQE